MAEVVGADEQRDEQRRLACLGGARLWNRRLRSHPEAAGGKSNRRLWRRLGGASERLQALAPGFGSRAALLVLIKQPQLCAGTQRATVRKVAGRKVGAASRGRPALPLPG